jgi:hypothetical protein
MKSKNKKKTTQNKRKLLIIETSMTSPVVKDDKEKIYTFYN